MSLLDGPYQLVSDSELVSRSQVARFLTVFFCEWRTSLLPMTPIMLTCHPIVDLHRFLVSDICGVKHVVDYSIGCSLVVIRLHCAAGV